MHTRFWSILLCLISLSGAAASVAAETTSSAGEADPSLFGWRQATPEKRAGKTAPSLWNNSNLAATGTLIAAVKTATPAAAEDTVYLELESDGKTFWAATRMREVQAGAAVRFSAEDVLRIDEHRSTTLERTFAPLYFITELNIVDRRAGATR